MYREIDYLIQLEAPFIERQNRIISRNDIYKDRMVARDLAYRRAYRIGNKKRHIDMTIKNTVTLEELQAIADDIYAREIACEINGKKETMKDKYGGYKVKLPIEFNSKNGQAKSNMIDKNGLTK